MEAVTRLQTSSLQAALHSNRAKLKHSSLHFFHPRISHFKERFIIHRPIRSLIRGKSFRVQGVSQNSASTQCQSDAEKDTAVWERVKLMERQLQISVREEDYRGAAKIRDELCSLKEQLSPLGQFMASQVDKVRAGSATERAEAVETLGRVGDFRVVGLLAGALHERDGAVVTAAETSLWSIFMRSGKPEVDARLEEGVLAMSSPMGFPRALDLFSDVIRMDPSFAEGYNKRATVLYLLHKYRESIEDCQRTVELNPVHFGALTGLGLCHVALKEFDLAVHWFQRALEVHPGMEQIHRYVKAIKQVLAEQNRSGESGLGDQA